MTGSYARWRDGCAAAIVSLALSCSLPAPLRAANAANDLICELYQPPRNGVLTACSGPFAAQDSHITISLAGTGPNRVREIRLTAGDQTMPFQTIPVDARPVIDIETVGILFMDMNFDGHADLAIMKSLATGYRYFLYAPETEKFRASDQLDTVAWPEFDQAAKTVRSYIQHPDGSSGHQTLIWTNGQLRAIKAP